MKIEYSSKFTRMYKKIPPDVKLLAEEKEKIFKNNPFDSRLKTHKLHGDLKGAYAFSVNYDHRIIFDFINSSTVLFQIIGNHDIYD